VKALAMVLALDLEQSQIQAEYAPLHVSQLHQQIQFRQAMCRQVAL
jgi:hypothetical protein